MNYMLFFITLFTSSAFALWDQDKAIVMAQQGKSKEALSALGSLLVDHPHDPALLYDAGVLSFANKDFDQALHYFNQAGKAQQAPSHLQEQIHFNAGNTYVKKNELEHAIEKYKRVLEINPDNEKAAHNLKKVEEMLKKQKEEEKQQDKQDKDKNDKQDNKDKKNKDQNKNKDKQDKKDSSSDKQKQDEQSSDDDQDQQEDSSDKKQDQQKDQQKKKDQQQKNKDADDKPDENDESEQDSQDNQMHDDKKDSGADQDDKSPDKGKDDASSPSAEDKKDEKQNAAPQEQKNAQEGAGMEKLDAQLAQVVKEQGDADANLNKQYIKLMVDQQSKRNAHGPQW